MSNGYRRWVLFLFLPLPVLGGCVSPTVSGGGSGYAAHPLVRESRWVPAEAEPSAGLGVDLRWHLLANREGVLRGFQLGLEEVWMPVPGHTWRGRRENFLLGWSLTPRQDGYPDPVGFEATFAPGWGRVHVGEDVESTFALGGRVGTLVRLPCWNHECDKGLYAGRWLLVLQAGWTRHGLVGDPSAPSSLGEGLFALGLRYDVSLLP
jgi:hypothetical protein